MSSMAALAPVIAATWAPKQWHPQPPWRIAENSGGGNRVRAARLADPLDDGAAVTAEQIETAAARMADLRQPRLFMVLDHQTPLDRLLEQQGYGLRDATLAMTADTAALAAAPPRVTCFETWPPLAVQSEIWAAGGIDTDRLAVMARAKGPKTALFGRVEDRPAGTAFVALQGDTAMLHALEVAPRHRRKRLAGHMTRAAADWARRHGANRFAILVTCENLPARGLYASLGFETVGQYHYRTRAD